MFWRREPDPGLERAYNEAVLKLRESTIGSEEYTKMLDVVSRLHKLRQEDRPPLVSKDTIVLAGTNLLGILLVIRHEHVNVITSRAMGMVTRLR